MPSQNVLVWKVNRLKPFMAAVRYRCLIPAWSLHRDGVPCLVLENGQTLRDYGAARALVIVKSFTESDVHLATQFRQRNHPVVLDICDNVYVEGYGGPRNRRILDNLDVLARLASAVVTTGETLRAVFEERMPPGLPVRVVPDPVETEELTRMCLADPLFANDLAGLRCNPPRSAGERAKDLRKRLVRRIGGESPRAIDDPGARSEAGSGLAPDRRTLIWFGNHGATHSGFGMARLVDLAPILARLNEAVPLQLLVVSDDEQLFEEVVAPFPFPTIYREWTPLGIHRWLRRSDVCVIPNSRDVYSLAKSANRATLALAAGVPVVASRIPSLEPLRDCLVLDDWEGGLRRYLEDPALRARDVARGQALVEELYGLAAVGSAWKSTLAGLAGADPVALGGVR